MQQRRKQDELDWHIILNGRADGEQMFVIQSDNTDLSPRRTVTNIWRTQTTQAGVWTMPVHDTWVLQQVESDSKFPADRW